MTSNLLLMFIVSKLAGNPKSGLIPIIQPGNQWFLNSLSKKMLADRLHCDQGEPKSVDINGNNYNA